MTSEKQKIVSLSDVRHSNSGIKIQSARRDLTPATVEKNQREENIRALLPSYCFAPLKK